MADEINNEKKRVKVFTLKTGIILIVAVIVLAFLLFFSISKIISQYNEISGLNEQLVKVNSNAEERIKSVTIEKDKTVKTMGEKVVSSQLIKNSLIARVFGMGIQPALLKNKYGVIEDLISEISKEDGFLYVYVQDSSGKLIASSIPDDPKKGSVMTDDLSKKALEVSKVTQFKLGNDESYEFVSPVFSTTSKIGIVRLGIKVNKI